MARSNAKAEYKAMSLGICEKIWFQKVLSNLHQSCEIPMKLFCDSKAAISITNNPIQYDRIKHVRFSGIGPREDLTLPLVFFFFFFYLIVVYLFLPLYHLLIIRK